jgi:hypothetical protein
MGPAEALLRRYAQPTGMNPFLFDVPAIGEGALSTGSTFTPSASDEAPQIQASYSGTGSACLGVGIDAPPPAETSASPVPKR